MKNDRILSLLGISAKAGKICSGEFAVENAVKSGEAFVVIVSEESSANTLKKFKNMCSFYQVPVFAYAGKEELGRCIGREYRAVAAVTDEGLAASIIRLFQ